MSGFQVPLSSSPPSTPSKKSTNGTNAFSFAASNPSTTPAGPPPSSAASFTPAGLPPSSFLGSSMIGVKPLSFSQQSNYEPSQLNFTSSKFPESPGYMRSPVEAEYQASRQRDLQNQADYGEEEDEGDDVEYQVDEDQDEDGQEYSYDDAEGMTDDEDMDDYPSESRAKSNRRGYEDSGSDLILASPGEGRRSLLDLNESFPGGPEAFNYGKIAKDLYNQMGIPTTDEPDDIILSTEAIITRLYDEGIAADDNNELLQRALKVIPGELTKLWATHHDRTAIYSSEEYATVIGPGPRASNFANANFLAGLALQIHHPKIDDAKSLDPKVKPLPQILLEWIDEHHDPYPDQFQQVQAHRPSPANHPLFWITILNALLRGKVVAVVNIMKNAGWRHAHLAIEEIHSQPGHGYTGVALANVEKVIGAATQVLSLCPAVHGDWNVRGSEWTLFRLRVVRALEDLKTFAEGSDKDRYFSETDRFGRSSLAEKSYSQTARKAESRVPWDIYQNLLSFYGIVIGESSAIIAHAQDWCEATVGLLVWWDEGHEDRQLVLSRSQVKRRTSSKESDAEIFLRKLRRSFELVVTAESTDFQVNTMNPVEVGLASLFEGDSESVVGFLRAWSGPVSSAVAEVATLAGWLPQAEPQSLINMGSLDQDDLDLLGINSSPSKTDGVKDRTLILYANSVSQRKQMKSSGITREGWELAIAILGRLDSDSRSEEMVGDFLRDFPLNSSTTVDRLWRLLNDIGMARHAESTAESYANLLAEGSHRYGEALWYYALSHKSQKVKDVLDLLISYSLIQSVAYPPEPELDDYLRRLISSPKTALAEMSRMDFEAAELLHKTLSGYATLRTFYVLRDDGIIRTQGRRSQMSAIVRKKEAAAALLAVITSSDDNIRGGLYDEERGSIVSVDFLLALLGEAMVFVNQPDLLITTSQIDTLLKTIEDLQAVGPRVYSACQEFLQTVIVSGQGLRGSSPADMLRKSTSNTSGTSSFSLVGSSMLASQLKQSMGSSGVLVKGNIKRGWDWRHGITAGTKAEDLLRILRLGLAKDLAKAWLVEADNKM